MTDIIVKIMVEVLGILAIATKEMRQGSTKALDKLTHDEVLMATAQVLKLAHSVNDKVNIIIDDGKEAKATSKEVKVIMQQTENKVDEAKRNQLQQDLRKWLSPPDPSTNHNIARASHHSGTASWFFQGSIFKEWKSRGPLLWVHGKPGSGKSILCSTIIQDIEAMCEAGIAFMAYFYFDFRDANKQNRHNLLTSLLTQLSTRSNHTCDILSNLYSSHNNGGRQPSDDVLIHCLKLMLSIPNQGPVYIVLDALDECPNTSGMPSPREQVYGNRDRPAQLPRQCRDL
ncbi:hypothetical protein B0F90DRAFT_1717032 [Multifurca ochricompacta]|uniref:NACHT domain-containing protein n=1 Tax=Multifurca ochricompacta TaxID=376703 RepID=A0AAD4M4N3_9AGAM|nr:hypothetical protein B0F90DRAFT_1717032 [Multifurca ochricompacta]